MRGPQSPQSRLSLVPEHWACLSQSYILASHWSRRTQGRVEGEVVTPSQVSLRIEVKSDKTINDTPATVGMDDLI